MKTIISIEDLLWLFDKINKENLYTDQKSITLVHPKSKSGNIKLTFNRMKTHAGVEYLMLDFKESGDIRVVDKYPKL